MMHRIEKINNIVESRSKWTLEDYQEAYGDIWHPMPTTIDECKEKMKEYIYHTYDSALLADIVINECSN